jgi:uncharacterized protein
MKKRCRSKAPRGASTRTGVCLLYNAGMFGMRVLIFLLGIALVVWILIRLAKGPTLPKKADKQVDSMVRCARCGVFTPRNEAIREGDRYYCSTAHRDEDS